MGGADGASPYGGAPWGEILAHTAQRLQWTDNSFEMLVFDQAEIGMCVYVRVCVCVCVCVCVVCYVVVCRV